MGSDPKHPACDGRRRVTWSPRGRRRWCPGAGRSVAAATTHVPTGWTAFLHWQTVVDALRGRRAAQVAAPTPTPTAAAPSATVPGTDLPRPEPRAPLPDRRRRAPSDEPALDGWLDATHD